MRSGLGTLILLGFYIIHSRMDFEVELCFQGISPVRQSLFQERLDLIISSHLLPRLGQLETGIRSHVGIICQVPFTENEL